MGNTYKATVTAIFPDQGYVLTVMETLSITFSLDVWKERYRPSPGDFVILYDVVKTEHGWRAKSACFFGIESEADLLPSQYQETTIGNLLKKWDPVFFLSTPNEEWQRLIREQNPDMDYLVDHLGLHCVRNQSLEIDVRIAARILFLMFAADVRELPFALPRRVTPDCVYDIKAKQYDETFETPFIWANKHGLQHGPYNLLTRLPSQLREFAVDIVIETCAALQAVRHMPREWANNPENYRKIEWAETKLRWYMRLIPDTINAFERESSTQVPTLIDIYDLDFLYRSRKAKAFEAIINQLPSFEIAEPIFEEMWRIIRDVGYHQHQRRLELLTEYSTILSKKYARVPGWNEYLWRNVIRFLITQRAPFSVFDPAVISEYLLERKRWDINVVQEILTILTNYLIVRNASWDVHDQSTLKLSQWVLEHKGQEDLLALQVQTYQRR